MARVSLNGDLARRFAGDDIELDLAADDVRSLIRQLDAKFPGIGEELRGDAVAVAIDGEIYPDALLEPLEPDSEVYFMPAIRGG